MLHEKKYIKIEIITILLLVMGIIPQYTKHSDSLNKFLGMISTLLLLLVGFIVSLFIIKKLRIEKIIIIYILPFLYSITMNIDDSYKYISYIFLFLSYYYLSCKLKDKYRDILISIFFIMTCYNLFKILTSNKVELGYKVIGNIIINRNFISSKYIMNYSLMSITTIYSLFICRYIKNKFIKNTITIINLVIILFLGKMSTIVTIGMSYIIVAFIRVFLCNKKYKKIKIIIISIVITSLAFISSFICVYIFNTIKIPNIERLLTGRIDLWFEFIKTIFNNPKILLFGNGFVNHNILIGGYYHPHNQYLTILYSIGIFGYITHFILYSFILSKNIEYSTENKDYKNLMLFLTIIMLQIVDDYFILTSLPISICIIIYCMNIDKVMLNK